MKQERVRNENLKEKERDGQKKKLPRLDLDTKKEIAKIAMTVSLGVTVVTSFSMKNKTMKTLHTVAGAALVGFSLWHHLLYQPDKKEKNKD